MNDLMEYEDLVYYVMKFFKYYKNKEDLFQAGCLGLVKASKNFSPEFNTKFSTYAYTYILGEMKKLVREDKGIKISKSISSIKYKIEKVYVFLTQKLSREPTIEEISDYLCVDESLVVEAMLSSNYMYSLETPIKEDVVLEEVISKDSVDIDTMVAFSQELENLSDSELRLLKESLLYNYTQTELAKIYNVNQVQVSRQLKKIKQKIKTNMY